jgi:hypothetical protein
MSIWFVAALSLLLTHEMDAVRRHEWRVLPLTAWIEDDERGFLAFTALHVPLYVVLLGAFFGGHTPTIIVFDIFCIVHVGLHLLFMRHPAYAFNNPFSWSLIGGAGIAGAIDLLTRW